MPLPLLVKAIASADEVRRVGSTGKSSAMKSMMAKLMRDASKAVKKVVPKVLRPPELGPDPIEEAFAKVKEANADAIAAVDGA